MATDQAPRAVGASGAAAEVPREDGSPRSAAVELTPVQVVAGSLAAVSAAVASSALGLAGTLIGAALAGVVVTVTNAVYLHSLNRTSEKFRMLPGRRFVRRPDAVPYRDEPAVVSDGAEPSDVEHVVDRQLAGVTAAPVVVAPSPSAAAGLRIRPGAPAWLVPATSLAAVIVVTVVAVAAFELSTGRTLASLFESGRSGGRVAAVVPGGGPYQANIGAGRAPSREHPRATEKSAPEPSTSAPTPSPVPVAPPSPGPTASPDPTPSQSEDPTPSETSPDA